MAIFSIFAFVWVNSAMPGRPDGRSVGRSVVPATGRGYAIIKMYFYVFG